MVFENTKLVFSKTVNGYYVPEFSVEGLPRCEKKVEYLQQSILSNEPYPRMYKIKLLGLIILSCGTIGGIGLSGSRLSCSTVGAQAVVTKKAEAKPIVPTKDETVVIGIREIDTLHEKRLSLEGKKINISVGAHHLTDEEVDVLCTLPNVQSVTIYGIFSSDEAIMKLTRLPDLRELHFLCGHSAITDAGVQMLVSFKKLESLTLAGNFSEDGYTCLGELGKLRELNLCFNTPVVTEKELVFLEKLSDLRKLSLATGPCKTADTDAGSTLSQMPDAVLSQLQDLNNLEKLTINCDSFTGSGLSHLSKLKSLRQLTLWSHNNLTASVIAYLEDLPQITELKISIRSFDDTGMASLGKMTNLRTLELTYAHNVTDAGLSQLRNLQELEDLTINSNSITGSDLSSLARLKSLRRFELASEKLTASGICHLKNLPQLTDLKIQSGSLSDAEVEPLKTLRCLKFLDISRTSVTKKGVDSLQRALPNCQIKR